MLTDQLQSLLRRIHEYITSNPLEVLVELAVIWIIVLLIARFLQGTRGARAIRGLVVILILATVVIQLLGREDSFQRLAYLYRSFLGFFALALVVVFHPELRRALVRLGEASFFGGRGGLRKARVIEELLKAVGYASKNKIGLLVAIERQVGLRGVIEYGTRLDAYVSAELLNTIFWPGSALHDMGVVITGDRVVAAGVQFPLAEGEQFDSELGSRHRAAIGLSQETDALIVIVSEETGTISVAERGELTRGLNIEQLRHRLTEGIGQTTLAPVNDTDDNETATQR